MSIKVKCRCGAVSKGRDHLAGSTIPCPRCKEPLLFPASPLPSLGITLAPADDPTSLTDDPADLADDDLDFHARLKRAPQVNAGPTPLTADADPDDADVEARQNRPEPMHVIVVDFRMPFGSMVGFMVKWAVATIPAMLILTTLAVFFWTVLAGLAGSGGS